ncbi:MAG: diadenylate cyclase CdaA [Desulfobulbaceae bacterium]|nr:TIGR00159 family protein [Candidatus Kapabacteria bacterium]MBS3999734.1 diadenylate cyclase CdaA [Desulfobulbaceae bacterium]
MTLFKIGFLTFTLIDLFDIIIVALIIYWVYRSLKNTVAVQILFGMVIIIGLQFITEAINFKSLNWILRTISDIWLIAFIILFQPELRKLLMIIVRSPIFRVFVKPKISETVDEVIEAAIEMSEKHIGALIVFTRSQNVQMTVDTGIPLQSMVSKELLLSIFNSKSPLHDGAVIIDNNMIVAARCVLPLSSQTKFGNKNLGTRHRAALGLSEQADTIVLVVSEETGGISISESGDMTLNIQHNEIGEILTNRLSQT